MGHFYLTMTTRVGQSKFWVLGKLSSLMLRLNFLVSFPRFSLLPTSAVNLPNIFLTLSTFSFFRTIFWKYAALSFACYGAPLTISLRTVLAPL